MSLCSCFTCLCSCFSHYVSFNFLLFCVVTCPVFVVTLNLFGVGLESYVVICGHFVSSVLILHRMVVLCSSLVSLCRRFTSLHSCFLSLFAHFVTLCCRFVSLWGHFACHCDNFLSNVVILHLFIVILYFSLVVWHLFLVFLHHFGGLFASFCGHLIDLTFQKELLSVTSHRGSGPVA